MNDSSTSGPIDTRFIAEDEGGTLYEELRSGGFNRLAKARRQGRWFVLKGLKTEFRDQQVYMEFLKKEYDLMVQLDHPNIAKVYSKELNDSFGPCIVMEYIDGVRLDTFLSGNPSRDARHKVAGQLVDALAYIHSKQILHRDLKPGNIMVTRNGGNVKIIDFGLADADNYAVLKQSAGTRSFMAPEQAAGGPIDCRADIYSFGLILKMLFPSRYRGIYRRCCAQDPSRRYPNMEAVGKALQASDRRRRNLPGACIAAVLSLALALSIVHKTEPVDGPAEEPLATDFYGWIQQTFWPYTQLWHQLKSEASAGGEYREIMLSRLSKLLEQTSAHYLEAANLYRPGSIEMLQFLSMCNSQEKAYKVPALDIINRSCPSFEEEFAGGRLTKEAYDSLKWLVSNSVMTLSVENVTSTSASCGAALTAGSFAGGSEVGICWGPCHNPGIGGRHVKTGTDGGRFTIEGLEPGSSYFVRAYLTGSAGTIYGNEQFFSTLGGPSFAPEGALPAVYSVGEGSQVYLSRGNLQYRPSDGTWRLAPRQFEICGKNNLKISETYDGWIDLFGWATSGYEHGGVDFQPWSGNKDTSSDVLHYAYGLPGACLWEGDGRADWGYNRILGAGNAEGLWRTPRVGEWMYLLFVRKTASGARFAKARVEGMDGLVLFPDNWQTESYPFRFVNVADASCEANVISGRDWERELEPLGTAFLPFAGARAISGIFDSFGAYYSSDAAGSDAWHLLIYDDVFFDARGHRGDGLSVRLVRDVE